ncbi:bZIP transcription factor [Paenibacillus sp. FSL R7-0337]|uniref:bZIP transcription factor n=1 Tax=Paenibacillus sp. FSL R7-0337 TaxID=1926588 RepID=UPI0009FA1DA9|nr:bZIP transcription factor [Paenibacillus sp. FSL R7-0337]
MKIHSGSLWLAAAMLAVTVTGCSSCSAGAGRELTEKLKAEISELKKENKFLKEENEALKKDLVVRPVTAKEEGGTAELLSTGDSPAAADSGDEYKRIVKGTPLRIDDTGEYTITKTSFSKIVYPSNPGSYYTYYEAKEPGTTYLAITLKVKNLAGQAINAGGVADVEVTYDNKYVYSTFATMEKNGGEEFTYTNISTIGPLKYGTLVFLAEVPDEVKSSGKPLYADFEIEGETYRYTIKK